MTGLSGDRHRPVLRRPDRHVHLPDERELRRRCGARRSGPGVRPGRRRARAHELPLQPGLEPDVARLARRPRRARRERRRHARPYAPRARGGRPAGGRLDARTPTSSRCAPAARRLPSHGRPRPRRQGDLRGAPRAWARARTSASTSSPTTSASSARCCAYLRGARHAAQRGAGDGERAGGAAARSRTASSSRTAPATRPR